MLTRLKNGLLKLNLIKQKIDEGIAEVIMDDKVGLINETGTYITEPKYDNIASFKDGFAEVKLDKKSV